MHCGCDAELVASKKTGVGIVPVKCGY